MKFAINGFKHANKDVRDAAYNLILNVFKYIGDNVRTYFKELRPVQISALEEGFDRLDGLNEDLNNQKGGKNKNQRAKEEYNNRVNPNQNQGNNKVQGGQYTANDSDEDGILVNL